MRRFLDRLYDGAGALGAFCVFLIFVLMILAGVGRQMNWHVSGLNDIVSWLCAAAAFFAMAHAFKHGDFVRVTLLLEKLPPGVVRRLELVALTIGAAATGYLAWWANVFTYESWQFNDIAQGLLPLPMWIPQLSFALGSILLFVALLDEWVIVVRGGRPSYVVAVEQRHAQGDFSSDV